MLETNPSPHPISGTSKDLSATQLAANGAISTVRIERSFMYNFMLSM
jgi:hypothetical protein